jgi:hypothetical protein
MVKAGKKRADFLKYGSKTLTWHSSCFLSHNTHRHLLSSHILRGIFFAQKPRPVYPGDKLMQAHSMG